MKTLTDSEFFDRVYACWMGKNVGGTLGGPLEGRMELLDIRGYTQSFVTAAENDDLDLQLVNLHCVEQNGGRADMRLLSREWLAHVHFEYDEYGHSLTNMRRGIGSPLSGSYNNFFTDCMGSPIRSEIWAVFCAGMPDMAAYYAYQDASVDHAGGEGIYGEIFFAALESLAFYDRDKFRLIDTALSYLPADCAVRRAVELLLRSFHEGKTWKQARQDIIDRFAGDNFTYAPVNIAFTLMGWLYEEGFTNQILTTADCGYDTDCTVATLGSLLGILYGSAYIDKRWTEPLGEKVVTSKPIIGFTAPATITELTKRSIAARRLVRELYAQQPDKSVYAIPYQSDVEVYSLPEDAVSHKDLTVTISRCPAYAPGETKSVSVTVRNCRDIAQSLELVPHVEAFAAEGASLSLAPGESKTVLLRLTAPKLKRPLWRGVLEIREFLSGVYWRSETVPLNMLPTMDWKFTADETSGVIRATENRVTIGDLPKVKDTLVFETTLRVDDSCRAILKLACANPLKLWVDGEQLIDCSKRTKVIPAYNRADPKKCAVLPQGKHTYNLRVEIGEAESFKELYFMVVTDEFYLAYLLGTVFECR